jgi:hypothetical protein
MLKDYGLQLSKRLNQRRKESEKYKLSNAKWLSVPKTHKPVFRVRQDLRDLNVASIKSLRARFPCGAPRQELPSAAKAYFCHLYCVQYEAESINGLGFFRLTKPTASDGVDSSRS